MARRFTPRDRPACGPSLEAITAQPCTGVYRRLRTARRPSRSTPQRGRDLPSRVTVSTFSPLILSTFKPLLTSVDAKYDKVEYAIRQFPFTQQVPSSPSAPSAPSASAVPATAASAPAAPAAPVGVSGTWSVTFVGTGLETIQRYRVTVTGNPFTGTFANEGKYPGSGTFEGERTSSMP